MKRSLWSFDWRFTVMPYEDQLRVEHLLANSRLFLASVALVAVYVDPHEPSVFVEATYSMLAAYTLFAFGLFVLARIRPNQAVGARVVTHVIDAGSAGAITALTQGTSSPFFVFFIFVLLAAALRWGVAPTAATGAAVALWYAAEAILQSPFSQEFDVTRFLMRTAYLLVATVVLAQLAGIQRAFYTDNYFLSRVLARLKRGDSFTESLEEVLEAALGYTGAQRAVLAVEDQTAERLYLWQMRAPQASRAAHVSLDELPRAERAALLFDPPDDAAVWSVTHGRNGSLRVRGRGADGAKLRRDVEPEPHVALMDRFRAASYVGLSVQLPQWDVRLLLFNPARKDNRDLRFLQRFGSQTGPALHSQYLVSRMRTRIGEVERARIARELHDGLIQSLIGLEMEVQALRQTRGLTESQVEETLEAVQQHLRRAVLDTRDLMGELRPPAVGNNGLLAEVSSVVERFRNDTGIDVRLSSAVDEVDCPSRTCGEVSRIVREALVNVRKHSGATHVVVHVGRDNGNWTLSIEDDGRGFGFAGRRTQAELDAARQGPGVIKERVRAIGGNLMVESEPERGARLEIVWPVSRRHAPQRQEI